jgi:DNA-binding MarR family transcriptional regulator
MVNITQATEVDTRRCWQLAHRVAKLKGSKNRRASSRISDVRSARPASCYLSRMDCRSGLTMGDVQRCCAPRYAVAMSNSSKAALARKVWILMFDFLMRSGPQRTKSLGRRGLTPNDARALSALDQKVGRTMRSLAEDWECDASNATWVVDRLERLGLAERRAVLGDRRVRHVVLTAKGRRTRADLMREYHAPPADLLELDRDQLQALHDAVAKLRPQRPKTA